MSDQPSKTLNTIRLSSLTLVTLLAILLVGCQSGPDPKISGLDFHDTGILGVGGSAGTEAFVDLECIVRNAGAAGEVEVIGRLEGADSGAFREIRRTVTLEENEEQKVALTFVIGGTGLDLSENEKIDTQCKVKPL